MIKVGTLTYHRSHNYGSVLQSYALEKVINSLPNVECEIIDYYPPNYKLLYSVFVKNNTIRNIARNLYVLLHYKQKKERYDGFVNFQKKYKVSKKSYIEDPDSLKDVDNLYDVVVCGSDQIWCSDAPDFSLSYFLPMLKKVKKVSYAPSMGYGELENTKYQNDVKNALKSFDFVSLREDDGAEKIKKLMGRDFDVSVVLDPTFLLPTDEYDKICSKRIIDEDYIFFYSVGFREQNGMIMEYVSKKLGLTVYTLPTSALSFKYKKYGIKFADKSSPEDFLSLIRNAKLVFSSSFHGNVFSIIFRKNFFSLYTVNNGKREDDPRLNTLTNSLKISNRAVDINNYESVDYYKNVVYDEEAINDSIKKSRDYLVKAILE